MPENKKKKAGRPKKHPEKEFDTVNEQTVDKLEMSEKEENQQITKYQIYTYGNSGEQTKAVQQRMPHFQTI